MSYQCFIIASGRDGYQLAFELDNAWQQNAKSGSTIDIDSPLRGKF
jgi:hypothetical protein